MSDENVKPDPYEVKVGEIKIDPYRIGRAYGLGGPETQLLKKVLRCGRKHKSREQDLREVISTAERIIEMDCEDSRMWIEEEDEASQSYWFPTTWFEVFLIFLMGASCLGLAISLLQWVTE